MSFSDFYAEFVARDEPHTVTATDAAASLLDLAFAGEVWARSAVFDRLRTALVKEIKESRQAASTIPFTDAGGRKRRLKTAVSRPHRDPVTGDVWVQLDALWDMDEAGLFDLLADLQRSNREQRERINAVRALLDALARHPECANAREAWAAEGRSVDEIDLSA